MKRSTRDDELLNLLGERMASKRTKLGISQEELAYRSGVSVSQISRLERGLHNPSISMVGAIAKVLECKIGDLVD